MTTSAPKALARSFVSSLRTLKKQARIQSNEELAEIIGVGDSTLRSWFKNRALPSMETIEAVRKRLTLKLKALHDMTAAVENALPRSR